MTEPSTIERESLTPLTHERAVFYAETPATRFLSWVKVLVQNRIWLLKVAIAGLVVSAIVAWLIPNRYEAIARLMPPDQSEGMGATLLGALSSKSGDAIGSLASDALGLRTSGASVVGILQSRTVQDDIINQFDLRKTYGKKHYDDTRRILAKRTAISEDHKSGIITIAVQDSQPERAAALARAYVNELNNRVAQLTTSSAHRERVFLEERLQTIKQRLDAATLQLSRFSSANKTFDPQMQGKAMLEAASNLQGQLIAAEAELSGLQQIYGVENSRVKSASARVADLRAKLRNMSGATGNSGDDAAPVNSNQLYPSLEQLPLLGNTYYDLARTAKIDESVYEILTRQYELAKVQEAKEIPSIKVLDQPIVPERKIWPPRLLIGALGTVLVLCFGVLWIGARNSWETMDANHPYRLMLTQACQMFVMNSDHRLSGTFKRSR
jgi:uncharacterized protein involved in exopolysaccharide biosynthesis